MDLGYTFKSVNSVKETDFVVESRIISHLIKETLSFYNQCSFFCFVFKRACFVWWSAQRECINVIFCGMEKAETRLAETHENKWAMFW
jgi:hypothetical protein